MISFRKWVDPWRMPRKVMAKMLADGVREDRALARLMAAAALLFVAQWPAIERQAQRDPSVPFDARLGAALFACVFLLPLLSYALAAVARLVARLFGGRGTWFGARLALFNALLYTAPLVLILAAARIVLSANFAMFLSIAVFIAFLYLWGAMLIEAERNNAI